MRSNNPFRLAGVLSAIFVAGCTVGAGDADRAYWQAETEALQQRAVELNVKTVKVPSANDAGYDIAVLKNDGTGNVSFITVPGAPSQHRYWTDFAGNIDKSIEFSVIERPGYGQSGPGTPVTDLQEQADAIIPVLKNEPGHCNIVMGSSYGAAIALQAALNEPDLVDGVIVLSGLMQKPARGARIMTLAGTLLSPIADYGDEIETVRRELANSAGQRRRIINQVGDLQIPVTIIHGEADDLVPVSNAFFLQKQLSETPDVNLIVVPDAGHEMMIKRQELLYEAIYATVKRVRERRACI